MYAALVILGFVTFYAIATVVLVFWMLREAADYPYEGDL